MEPQGEQEERRELGDEQRSRSSESETVPLVGAGATAASEVRLCGASAAAAPSPVPSVCSQGQVCASAPGLHVCWMAGTPASVCPGTVRDAQALIGP